MHVEVVGGGETLEDNFPYEALWGQEALSGFRWIFRPVPALLGARKRVRVRLFAYYVSARSRSNIFSREK